ncbi:MAG: AAA family ATPase [Methanoregula sp.]|jgi:lon-related putative ATP-dependent protease|nr:AAA family ATPase [Methanoregula sp.]
MIKALPIMDYRASFNPDQVECSATETLKPSGEIIGQERAQKALRFGLEIREKGFNIYVAGIPGTGRKTAVRELLAELAKTKPKADDWIYVNNFANPYEPNAIRLPPGMSSQLKTDMSTFIVEARRALPRAFESEDYATKREEALGKIDKERVTIVGQVTEKAAKQGFTIQMGPTGLMIIPVVEDKPLTKEDFEALQKEKKEEILKKREALDADLRSGFRQLRELDVKGGEVVSKLNTEIALYAIGDLLTGLKEKYRNINEVIPYIESIQKDILDNLGTFLGSGPQQQQQEQVPPQFQQWLGKDLAFRKYEINVVVDNSRLEGAPVVFEDTPSYPNLLGRAEKEVQFGVVTTDFMMIRSGSLHKANGGYLVIPVQDLFRYPFAWDGLKSALKTEKIKIEEPGEQAGLIMTRGLKPEPIPLNVKVILIGTPDINQILNQGDPDYNKLFKVKADFDTVMDRTEENLKSYAAFIRTLCKRFTLTHLDNTAVAKVVEYGSRLADDKKKLSTRFSGIADLIKEANFYAIMEKASHVTVKHIEKALEEKIYRSNLIQQKIQEFIERGVFLIDTEGTQIGQINGLSVMELGDFTFGRPSRVTASIAIGRDGIIDIERQAQLGGPTHTKGVLILGGYLANKYAQDKPLSLTAKLVFEQSYGGVDGDSASSTELYAILSALSGLPLKQSIAVTGSVNQRGEVQAIGGVNEKLEGFFEVCKAKGLTGDQGAMIPSSNVQNLMLKEELLDAAKTGKFAIYPARTIDEGIEFLTGVPAGERRPDGSYREGTVNYLVNKRLQDMADMARDYQVALR